MLKELDNGQHALTEPDSTTLEGQTALQEARPSSSNGHHERPAAVPAPPAAPATEGRWGPRYEQPILAIFCYEDPTSSVGRHVAGLATSLARRNLGIHIFARRDFELEKVGVSTHPLGDCDGDDVIRRVHEFGSRACNAFLKVFHGVSAPITLMSHEWSSIPAMSLLAGIKNIPFILSLHSLERQRSDMSSELSRSIEQLELSGLREARDLLVHEQATANVIRSLLPECSARITAAAGVFPAHDFEGVLDPGAVKARYQVGPVDPMILFVGDLSPRYGPDMLVKSLPPVLRNHPQSRLVIVGEGELYWPLRVFTRYLLLEHAVRLVGDVRGEALRELVQAADVVVVPSREDTPWWPIQASWAGRRPVVATHPAAPGLIEHEQDGILVYPSENSLVWGIERVLFDSELRTTLAVNGSAKLGERFGFDSLAAQLDERINATAAK
jgi:glycosyltransferase involved in cell wall biosynthesis